MADPEIDRAAFRSLTSGLYVVSSKDSDGRDCGCVVNTLLQVASKPPQLLVSINKENATAKAVDESGVFCASVLSQEATMELIGLFGFQSSYDVDKFSMPAHEYCSDDIPCLTEKCLACFTVDVDDRIDVESHIVFIGKVRAAKVIAEGEPLTYSYYHKVLRGKTPPKAASYNSDAGEGTANVVDTGTGGNTSGGAPASGGVASVEEAVPSSEAPKVGWRCTMCGFVVEGYPDGLPEDFKCPACQMGREYFEKITL